MGETHRLFGKDMFVIRSAMENVSVVPGDPVKFSVEHGRTGPQACNIQPLNPSSNGGSSGGWPDMMSSGTMADASGGGTLTPSGLSIESTVSRLAGRVFAGTLKRWNTERGFGHIECKETETMFGKDMFVLKSSFLGVGVNPESIIGSRLRFSLTAGRNGAEARNIEVLSDNSSFGMQPASDVGNERWFVGTVANYSFEKGFGHIRCDDTQREFGRDVFVSKMTVPGNQVLHPGDQVRFTVRVQEKGPATEKIEKLSSGHMMQPNQNDVNAMGQPFSGDMSQGQQFAAPHEFAAPAPERWTSEPTWV